MRRDAKSLLWDARDAADVITVITAGKTFAEFDQDIVLRSAVERQFEIIGEALAQLARVDTAMTEKIPDLREIIAFRNVLIHGYARIDRARVWRVAQENLPQTAYGAGQSSCRARVMAGLTEAEAAEAALPRLEILGSENAPIDTSTTADRP